MRQLSDLLAPLALPAVEVGGSCASGADHLGTGSPADPGAASARLAGIGPAAPCAKDVALVQELGVGLPAGHLHVWGGPTGAGKTAFLLALLHGAAAQGRRVLYASYDLPPETLALRLLAMTADVDSRALAAGRLEPAAAARAAHARLALERTPFHLLAARGLSVASLEDRLVRMPFRAEVLAVDYLQAVVREVNTDSGRALRDLSAVATRLHVAVVCAMRSADAAVEAPAALDGLSTESADRVGWIAPADGPGARRAEILRSRYGARSVLPLTLDLSNGALHSG